MSDIIGARVELRGYDAVERNDIVRSLEMLNRLSYRRFYKSGLRAKGQGVHAEVVGDAVSVTFYRRKRPVEKAVAPVLRAYRIGREGALRKVGKTALLPQRLRWRALSAARPQAPADPFSRDLR